MYFGKTYNKLSICYIIPFASILRLFKIFWPCRVANEKWYDSKADSRNKDIYIDIYVCVRNFQIQEILKGTHQCVVIIVIKAHLMLGYRASNIYITGIELVLTCLAVGQSPSGVTIRL